MPATKNYIVKPLSFVKNIEENRYCFCSHTIDNHLIVDQGNENIGAICFGMPDCICDKYRQDNLIYIEKICNTKI